MGGPLDQNIENKKKLSRSNNHYTSVSIVAHQKHSE